MLIGDPVSESQGLEDVGGLASRPKVPKPPNRTALAANRKSETGSGCIFIAKKLANWHISLRGSVSIQTKSIRDSILKHQSVFPHDVRCSSRPIWIGLAEVRKPTRTQFSSNSFHYYYLLGLGLVLEAQIPENVVDQMEEALVDQ